MKTLVIMPTYNEAETLADTIAKLFEFNPEVDLLVVDDNSPDGTAEIALGMSSRFPKLSLLSRESKGGLGPAYLAGFDWALDRGYELIVEMDADGSHQGKDLVALLVAARDADLVLGSRWISGGAVVNWPLGRQLISRIGNRYASVMLGTKIRDMTSGFRVYRAALLRELDLSEVSSQGYSFQVEMAYLCSQNGKVVEIPITFVERIGGISKMTSAIVLEALAKVTSWGLKRIFR